MPSILRKFDVGWNQFVTKWIIELKKCGVNQCDDTSAIQLIPDWLENGKQSLLISGGVGNGKTTIASALKNSHNDSCKDNLREENIAKYVTARQIIGMAMQGRETKTSQTLKSLHDCYGLIIDDLGIEQAEINNYGTIETPVIELLEKRYEKRLPTIITTNLDMEQIKEKYGIRIHDRIIEQYSIIGLNQKSFRK